MGRLDRLRPTSSEHRDTPADSGVRGEGGRDAKIVIVGGGYAGFYTVWKLEKRLRRNEAEVVLIDPRPYMTYQPFLPRGPCRGN